MSLEVAVAVHVHVHVTANGGKSRPKPASSKVGESALCFRLQFLQSLAVACNN